MRVFGFTKEGNLNREEFERGKEKEDRLGRS